MTKEYRQSLTELKTILVYMDPEDVQKIPEKIISFINKNYDSDYTPSIDRDIPLDKQNIKKDTRVLLSIFYRYYWCEAEERNRLLAEDRRALEEFKNKMSKNTRLEDVLERQKSAQRLMEEVNKAEEPKQGMQMVSTQKTKWYQRIFEKLSTLFKK